MTTPARASDDSEREKLTLWRGMESRLVVYLSSFSGLSAEDREDLLQTVLVAFWAKGPRAADEARAWLYRVARNAAIDALRAARRSRRARSQAAAGGVELYAEPVDPSPGPEDGALTEADLAFVRAFLAELSDRERELAYLCFSEGLSYARIAEVTGMPLGTVKWRMAGVKRRLAKRYGRVMA